MISFFARTTLLGLSVFASAASAKPFHSLDTIKAEFIAQKSTRYESASATVNYANDTMNVVLKPICSQGDDCDSNEPAVAEYSFADVNSTVNRCGVIKTVAVIDHTPADGVRTQVTLTDASNYTCRGRKPETAKLIFEQKWYDRLHGKWIMIRDNFTADHVETMVAFQGLIRAELKSVISEAFKGGSLFFDGRQGLVELTLNNVCREGQECDPENLEPETFTLNNALTKIDSCGVIQTVASFDDTPVDGISLKVTINNNRNNTCPTFAPLNALDVVVEKAYYNRFEAELVKTQDLLKADDFALIKPGK